MRYRGVVLIGALLFANATAQAQGLAWQQTAGPQGGSGVSAIVYSAGGTFFALTGAFGQTNLARSNDDGRTWTPVAIGRRVLDLKVRADTVLADTGEGLFRSLDDGSTWHRVEGGPPGLILHEWVNSPFGRFARTDDGVYRSHDGRNWEKVEEGLYFGGFGSVATISASPGGDVYLVVQAGCCLGYGGGLYRWEEGQAAWVSAGVGTSGRPTFLAFDEAGRVFLGSASQDEWSQADLRISEDGQTWRGANLGSTYDIVFAPGGTIYAATYLGVRRSQDGGTTWEAMGLGYLAVYGLALSEARTLIAGTGGYCEPAIDYNYCYPGLGAFRHEDDAAGWEQVDLELPDASVLGLAPAPDGALMALALTGLWRTDDRGATWTKHDGAGFTYPFPYFLNYSDPDGLHVTPEGDVFAVSGFPSGLYRFAPERFDDPLENQDGEWQVAYYRAGYDLLARSDGTLFLAVGRDGLVRSMDRGDTWEGTTLTEQIYALARDGTGRVYAGGAGRIYRSDDGETWLPSLLAGQEAVRALAVAPGGVIYAAQTPFILRSDDRGATWEQAGHEQIDTEKILVNSLGTLFVIHEQTVYVSTDQGASWQAASEGLPSDRVVSLALDADEFLYAGTLNAGVFRTNWPARVSRAHAEEIPEHVGLGKAYPNPFNPATTLPFTLPHPAHVTLTVYDGLGREVAVLLAKDLPAGTHEVVFDASALPSGTYFYRLDAGGHTRTRAITLVK